MTKLRVLANLCSVVPRQVGGTEVYATRLLAAVASQPAVQAATLELELASMAGVRAAHPGTGQAGVARGSLASRQPGAPGPAVESTWLTRRSAGFDVVHHFGGRLPARRSGVSVLTVHDIQPLDLPANFSAVKRRYLGWALPRSVRAADLVVVPSRWVADRLAERLAVTPGRIRVVPPTYARPDITGADASGGHIRRLRSRGPSCSTRRPRTPTRIMRCSSRPTPRSGTATGTCSWCSPGPRAGPTPR